MKRKNAKPDVGQRPAGVPEDAKRMERAILAEGEVTGHFHEALGNGASMWDTGGGTAVLDAPNGAEVVHQEHGKITVPAGQYNRELVKEYDPFEEEARNVHD
jgi:hypothetical protein